MTISDDPVLLCEAAFDRLARGVADRRSPFHTPALATVGLGGAPDVRTVVLRGFDRLARNLRVHADARSGKIRELMRDPRCALLFYDAGARLQLRIEARAVVHRQDELALVAWNRSQPMSRACYAAPVGPGVRVDAPPPAPPRSEEGFANFCVVACAMERLDVLSLDRDGHRRIEVRWPRGEREIAWLSP